MNKMTMVMAGETDLIVTRRFNAPPQAVYDAHLDAEKLKRWMLGPEGWEMPHCEMDARPGGKFSYTWKNNETGESFTISGTILSLDPPNRIEHGETMDVPGATMPESRVVTEFAADGDDTLMTMTITYDSAESRQGALESGMEEGMGWSYDNLDRMVSA